MVEFFLNQNVFIKFIYLVCVFCVIACAWGSEDSMQGQYVGPREGARVISAFHLPASHSLTPFLYLTGLLFVLTNMEFSPFTYVSISLLVS